MDNQNLSGKTSKKLSLILFGVGLLVFALVFIFIVRKNKNVAPSDETTIEVPFADRPVVSLTPRSDGHWLDLKIEKFKVPKAVSLDYELLYTLPDGRVQGVPGTVQLEGISDLKRELLLGSESSGKFRYDEGVKDGNLTIRFRDGKRKLLVKFATKFRLQTNETDLTSIDENFTYKLEKPVKGEFFVTMETFGLPAESNITSVSEGPYGVFSSLDAGILPSGQAEGWQIVGNNLFYK